MISYITHVSITFFIQSIDAGLKGHRVPWDKDQKEDGEELLLDGTTEP